MTILEAMQSRHSVRSYKGIPLRPDAAAALQQEIERCNREGGLHMQLVAGEPKAFDSLMAHYGKFSGVQNYIALIGKKSADLEEKLGCVARARKTEQACRELETAARELQALGGAAGDLAQKVLAAAYQIKE